MRTRFKYAGGIAKPGMEAIVFNVGQMAWALEFEEESYHERQHGIEHVKDAAPILGNILTYFVSVPFLPLKNREDDYSELYIKQFIKYAGIPVVSLESATLHPWQSLTDIITITEHLKKKDGPKLY